MHNFIPEFVPAGVYRMVAAVQFMGGGAGARAAAKYNSRAFANCAAINAMNSSTAGVPRNRASDVATHNSPGEHA
jgi:hypothetical protein